MFESYKTLHQIHFTQRTDTISNFYFSFKIIFTLLHRKYRVREHMVVGMAERERLES